MTHSSDRTYYRRVATVKVVRCTIEGVDFGRNDANPCSLTNVRY